MIAQAPEVKRFGGFADGYLNTLYRNTLPDPRRERRMRTGRAGEDGVDKRDRAHRAAVGAQAGRVRPALCIAQVAAASSSAPVA